jgi:hypothetical protein
LREDKPAKDGICPIDPHRAVDVLHLLFAHKIERQFASTV